MKQNIELHIEELVLHGFTPSDAPYIKAAIEQQLSMLFTSQGIPPTLSVPTETDRLNAGTFSATAGSSAEVTGNQIAETVYKGIMK